MLWQEEEDRSSPVAFTVEFGGGASRQEKHKKLERFALRSSQRKARPGAGMGQVGGVQFKILKF